MKKVITLLAVLVSFVALTACSSSTTTDQTAAPAKTSHHDYKGEMSTK